MSRRDGALAECSVAACAVGLGNPYAGGFGLCRLAVARRHGRASPLALHNAALAHVCPANTGGAHAGLRAPWTLSLKP
eukprot:7383797-Prymnesium_polylepis.1